MPDTWQIFDEQNTVCLLQCDYCLPEKTYVTKTVVSMGKGGYGY